MSVKLHLTFQSQAALQDFLDRHASIEDGLVGCTPTPAPPPDPVPSPPETTPPNAPPVAVLQPVSGVTSADTWGFSTDGTVDPDGTIASATIAWGDGTPNTVFAGPPDLEVPHVFPTNGSFTITYTVVDSGGLAQTATITVQVQVAPVAPIAALTFVSGEFTGSPVVLSTAGTTAPVGSLASWDMNWGDGSAHDSGLGAPPATLSHTYSVAGVYNTSLLVTNTQVPALSGIATLPLLVQAPAAGNPPVTSLSLTFGATLGDSFAFALTGTDPEAGPMTWSLDYGDGSAPATGVGTDLPTTRSRLYAAAGTYTVIFRVTDTQTLTTTKTLTVTVAPLPDPDPENISPVVALAFVSGQFVGELITLASINVYDPDGAIASWSLSWGDGTAPDTGLLAPPLTHTHTYAGAGTYTATLTAVDNLGLAGSASLSVIVQASPAPQNQPPTAGLTVGSGQFAGDVYALQLTGTDSDGTVTGWALDFGDGSPLVTGTALPVTRFHTYGAAGSYTARLTVTDDDGATGVATAPILVASPPLGGTYPYYDALVARSDRLYAMPLRSQAELDGYPSTAKTPPRIAVVYDPVFDGCLQQINPAVTGVNTPQQKLLPIVIPMGTSFFLTWDQQLDAGWAYLGAGYIPNAMKSYRFDLPEGQGAGIPNWINLKHFWQNNLGGTVLCEYKLTAQSDYFVLPPTTYSSETPGPNTPFYITANRLTRTSIFYDAAVKKLSLWAADGIQGTIQMLNQIAYDFPTAGVAVFRLEYATSYNPVALNPLSKAWNRNLVVNQGLSYATAVSLLSTQGL